jgi:hypothetical protein
MEKIFSSVEKNRLLHFIHRKNEFGARVELIEVSEILQLSSQIAKGGQSFRAHRHIPKPLEITDVTAQESWVVISGLVEVSYFDLDDSLISTHRLSAGDASVTLAGGHGYEIIEESLIYEFKTGPYLGVEYDKVFI